LPIGVKMANFNVGYVNEQAAKNGSFLKTTPAPLILSSKRVVLRPVSQNDLPKLYEITIDPKNSYRWRHLGILPTFDEFVSTLFNKVLIQFVITSKNNPTKPLGLVICYSADVNHGFAYIAILTDSKKHFSTIGIESMALFINYLFNIWPFRKLYFESIEYNIYQFKSGFNDLFHQEARYKSHIFHQGFYWDMIVGAIYKEEFLSNKSVRKFINLSTGQKEVKC
jgi:RimJ/RimL family protein N-acetyltransferase